MDFSATVEKEHFHLDLRTKTPSKNKPIKQQEFDIEMPLKEVEKKHILKTLKAYSFNKTRTAKALGISLRTLRNKINEYESK